MFYEDPSRLALETIRLSQPLCAQIVGARQNKLADRLRSALLRIYLDLAGTVAPRSRVDRFRRLASLGTAAADAAIATEEAAALHLVTARDADQLLAMLETLTLRAS